MKIYLAPGTLLNGFERDLLEVLIKANLAGCALIGYAFREIRGAKIHNPDATD